MWLPQKLYHLHPQGFGRCAPFTLGYCHAVCFADWLNVETIVSRFTETKKRRENGSSRAALMWATKV